MAWQSGVTDLPDEFNEVPLFTAQAVGVALVLGLLIGATLLGYFLMRRRSISASAPSLTCGFREAGKQRWRSAFIRLGTHTLDCFAVLGVGSRPLRSWDRAEVDLSIATDAQGLIPGISDPVWMTVRSPQADEVFEIAIERSAYPALRSWTESSPPRGNSVV
ncbi:MAG: DUF2550 family protein [Actinomycetia bacterium]|nr:DUF2550 family protein [Actinomycetes bacterium]